MTCLSKHNQNQGYYSLPKLKRVKRCFAGCLLQKCRIASDIFRDVRVFSLWEKPEKFETLTNLFFISSHCWIWKENISPVIFLSLSFQQGYAKIPAGPASVKILPIQYSSVTSVYYTIKILVFLGSIYLSIHPFTILMQLKTVQPNILRPISFHAKSYSPNYCT